MPVEKTSKPLKLAQLVTMAATLASVAYGATHPSDEGLHLAGIGVAGGIIGYILVRVLGWWQYG